MTFWKYDPGPTSVVVDVGGTIGSLPLENFLEVIVYFGALGNSGFPRGSYVGPGVILSNLYSENYHSKKNTLLAVPMRMLDELCFLFKSALSMSKSSGLFM